ncbi:MAG TPA: hypothetical protein VK358_12335, partial [Longimicrobium sp.]|nr:hypothetical protein [Longimicrobium sp.]
ATPFTRPPPMPFALRPRLLALAALAACGGGPESQAGQADSLGQASPPVAAERPAPASAAAAPSGPAAQEIRSVHTSVKADDCKTISVEEEGSGGSIQRCPGTAGYTLLALDGDARMSITVVDPAGREHPLEYWTTVTGGFSSLGDRAEWRVRGEGASAVPVALIVPLRVNEHPDDPERLTPYRVVARVTPAEACVTHRLSGDTPDAEVRRLADASASAPCRTSYDEP